MKPFPQQALFEAVRERTQGETRAPVPRPAKYAVARHRPECCRADEGWGDNGLQRALFQGTVHIFRYTVLARIFAQRRRAIETLVMFVLSVVVLVGLLTVLLGMAWKV